MWTDVTAQPLAPSPTWELENIVRVETGVVTVRAWVSRSAAGPASGTDAADLRHAVQTVLADPANKPTGDLLPFACRVIAAYDQARLAAIEVLDRTGAGVVVYTQWP